MDTTKTVTIIGGGLAGCEAALQLAGRGVPVLLFEMRPVRKTSVHKTDDLSELVCSNSLKSTDVNSAAGLLKYEIAALGSQLLGFAFKSRVPAGGALAVDRERFAELVTKTIEEHPLIQVVRREITTLAPYVTTKEPVIVATGPLTSDELANDIARFMGSDNLAFFDAAAPIIEADSLDYDVLFAQSRYDRGGTADYLNAPFGREQYESFIAELVDAEKVIAKDFETKELFSACQPIEEVARSGLDALRYGALKPVGLTDPKTGKRPWAAVQLRAENTAMNSYNLVGFQTNLTFSEQNRVFRMIPGLENAAFARYGVMHRNTFIDAPHTLDRTLASTDYPNIRFAGQICGTEGYVEAIASGLFAALCTYTQLTGSPAPSLPIHTVFGSLLDYATDPQTSGYQPMHVNYGIIEPLDTKFRSKQERYAAYSTRARDALQGFIATRHDLGFLEYDGPSLLDVSEQNQRRS